MTPAQCVGSILNSNSTLTALVTTSSLTRIFHGTRPVGSTPTAITPCINYFEMPGGIRQYGIERKPYTINCRATTAAVALQMQRLVVDLFHGTSGTGVWGNQSNFSVIRTFVRQTQGVLFEQGENVYNCPVDIWFSYPVGSVS